jgi:uncharacterized membrane protein YfcA
MLAAGIISLAYLVRGIAGFGSGLIAIPLLALIIPLTAAVPLIVLLDYIASASHGLKHRQQIQWPEVIPLLPFTAVGVVSALYLFKSVKGELLLDFLGIIILIYAVYSLFDWVAEKRISRMWAVPGGALGGLIGTLFGTGGPFYVSYLKFRGLDKSQFRATFATIFLVDGAARLSGYLATGFFQLELFMVVAAALPVMVLALYFGGQIHTSMSQRSFQRGISLLLLFSGVSLLMK